MMSTLEDPVSGETLTQSELMELEKKSVLATILGSALRTYHSTNLREKPLDVGVPLSPATEIY